MFALGLSYKPLGWPRPLHWAVRFVLREATRLVLQTEEKRGPASLLVIQRSIWRFRMFVPAGRWSCSTIV